MDTPPDALPVTPSHNRPPDREVRERDSRFSVMATAAGTSAFVSLLTLWLWTPAAITPEVPGGTVSVTYELLEAGSGDDGSEATDLGDAPDVEPAVTPAAGEVAGDSLSRRAVADRSVVRVSDTASPSRLAISTKPEGASVTINGVGYGTTPLTIPYLPPGAKRIRVTKAGYESEERYYSSDAGRASSLQISLRELSRGQAPNR